MQVQKIINVNDQGIQQEIDKTTKEIQKVAIKKVAQRLRELRGESPLPNKKVKLKKV